MAHIIAIKGHSLKCPAAAAATTPKPPLAAICRIRRGETRVRAAGFSAFLRVFRHFYLLFFLSFIRTHI